MPIKPRIDYVKIFDVSPDHVEIDHNVPSCKNSGLYYNSTTINALVERALLDDRNRAEKAYRKIVEKVNNGLGNSAQERQMKEVVSATIENVIRVNSSDPEEYTRVK